MCRWTMYLSQEPILVADVILRPKHSLLKQIDQHYLPGISWHSRPSDDGSPNSMTNIDGFGLGFFNQISQIYDPNRPGDLILPSPCVYRSLLAPIHDTNVASLAKNIESSCVVGHIRAGQPIASTSVHPFQWGRWLFQHNGGIDRFNSIKIPLLQMLSETARDAIKGTTDSEHVAALFFTFLEPNGPWTAPHNPSALLTAFRRTISSLQSLISNFGGYQPNHWTSLNVGITDGLSLFACRWAYPHSRDAPALYWSTRAGATLDRRYEGHPDGKYLPGGTRDPQLHRRHIIVASEPSTYNGKDWILVEDAEAVLVGPEDLEGSVGHGEWAPKRASVFDSYFPSSRSIADEVRQVVAEIGASV